MCDVKLKIWLRQSMHIYLKSNPATKFHPDPIWNNGAFVFLKDGRPNKKNKKNIKKRNDMRSVSDQKSEKAR